MTNFNMACLPLRAVISDICAWSGDRLSHNLEYGYDRIHALVKTRGVRVLLEDLPAYGKAIDRGLSRGFINLDALPGTIRGKGSLEKLLFRDLLAEVFDLDSLVNNRTLGSTSRAYVVYNADPDAVFFIRQLCYMYKKIDIPCPPSATEEAVKAFFEVDRGLRVPTLLWDSSLPGMFSSSLSATNRHGRLSLTFDHDLRGSTSYLREMMTCLQDIADRMTSLFPKLEIEDVFPRHGPGAVADLKSGADKYQFPHWPTSLEEVFPQDYFAFSSEEWAADCETYSNSEPSGRLLAVPKDYTKPRLITAEPTAHQFIQQGLMKWMRKNLPNPLRHSYDYKSQEPSQQAALLASAEHDKATVDLSAASDRLSLWVVERVFRRNPSLLHALFSCRTKYVHDCTGTGYLHEKPLRKFSGMGSGVTFPVQTYVYWLCCVAADLWTRDIKVTYRNIKSSARRIRVFGDDLIVPRESLLALGAILRHLQLKVNVGKTHYDGRFRESCGMDSFQGHDVTPVYLTSFEPIKSKKGRTTATGLVSWVDVSNNAYSAGLWNLSAYLDSLVTKSQLALIPVSNKPQSCLTRRTYQQGLASYKSRYNRDLCRDEILGLQLLVLESNIAREGSGALLSFFTEYRPISYSEIAMAHLQPERSWRNGYSTGNFFKLKKKWVCTW